MAELRHSLPDFGYGVAVSVLVVILLTELVVYVRVQVRRRKDLPPGPRPWPILGNLPAVAVPAPHLKLQQLASQFGPLVYLRLGSVPCVVVSTAEAARALVLAHDEHLSSRPKLLGFRILTEGKTMGTAPSPGKLWHSMRRFSATELLSSKRVASYEPLRKEEVRNMMQLILDTSNKREPVNLKLWLFQTAANLTTRMLVKKRIYHGNETNSFPNEVKDEFEQWLKDRLYYLTPPVISDYVPWLRFFSETVQGWRAEIEAYRDRESAMFVKMIDLDERRKLAADRDDDAPDFVDLMLRTPVDDGKILGDRFILQQTFGLFAAGAETSSTTVEWAMAELALHPELLKRAQTELDVVVGMDRLVQESDIARLPFLQACIKETFRLHPSSPLGMPRESTAPVEALGYKLPAGTRIIYNAYAIQRDEAVYENPGAFDPDRFLHRHLRVNHLSGFDSYELIPFGVGRRVCPGANLGNTVVHFMLANLIHSYDWSVPDGVCIDTTDTKFSSAGTLSLKNPLTLVPKARDGVPAF